MTLYEAGGPAFPTMIELDHCNGPTHAIGITVLDYFAAKALQGMLTQHSGEVNIEGGTSIDPLNHCCTNASRMATAREAYDLAAAMIAERDKRFTDQVEDEA
jgi:hypothetical protein